MFKALFRISASTFVFASGLMISVATSAAAQLAFASEATSNDVRVAAAGLVAFLAGALWFLLSETLAVAGRKVDLMASALRGREAAIDALPRSQKVRCVVLFGLAAVLSLAWPWASQITAIFSASRPVVTDQHKKGPTELRPAAAAPSASDSLLPKCRNYCSPAKPTGTRGAPALQ